MVKRLVAVLAVSAALVGAWAPSAGAATGAKPAPMLANPSASGQYLAERYLDLLARRDVAGLQRFLAPEFQVARADGSGATKAEYLAALPTITASTVSGATGTQRGGSLVVRYMADITGMVNGKAYRPGPAPRLAAFRWDGHRWVLTAYGNFNPLS